MNSKQRRRLRRELMRKYPFTLTHSLERATWCAQQLNLSDYHAVDGLWGNEVHQAIVNHLNVPRGSTVIMFVREEDAMMCKLATIEPETRTGYFSYA